MPAIEILGLEKTYTVGFWRKRPKHALRPLASGGRGRRDFRLSGTKRRRQNHHSQTADGPDVSHQRHRPAFWAWRLTIRVMKAQIGFLPEQPYFYDYLTARELLRILRTAFRSRPQTDVQRRVNEVLQRVGLPDVGGVQLRKFSKGMLQRVGIAQAILHDPKVVFFDEPMSGLDPMGRREVRDLMEQLKHEGKTVFFSTHILSDAEALCDRVAIINRANCGEWARWLT